MGVPAARPLLCALGKSPNAAVGQYEREIPQLKEGQTIIDHEVGHHQWTRIRNGIRAGRGVYNLDILEWMFWYLN